MEYLLHIGIMLCIYIILVLSTNLTVGMANLLTMCQSAFYDFGSNIGFSEMEIASNIAEAIQKSYVPSMESIC